jgi:hypothetical protein
MMVVGPEPDSLPAVGSPLADVFEADPRPASGRRARRTAHPHPEHRRR